MDNHNIELLAGIVGNQAHSAKETKETIKYLERVRLALDRDLRAEKEEVSRLRKVVGERNNEEVEFREEIERLKKENKALNLFSRRTFKSCLDKIGHAEMTDIIGQIRYIGKDLEEYKAKASKLNAEKRKLLDLLSGHSTSAEVRRDYNQYLNDRKKKGK